jgi:hypothetical protein
MVDLNENVLHRRGDEGRDHIPAVPFWIAIIRAFQLVCDSFSFERKCLLSTTELIICIAFRILHNGSVCLCCFCVWCWIRKFCLETPLRVELYLLFLQFPGYGKELPSRPREYRLTRRVRHELFRFRMDHWVPSLCVYPSLRLLTEQLTNREYRSSLLRFGSPRPTSSGHSSSLKS